MEYSPKKMTEELNKENFNFKKKFGQNFIVDKNIIHSIISKANIDKDTLVIEIGPGAGSLTAELDKVSGHVIAYEIDKTLLLVPYTSSYGIYFGEDIKVEIKYN